jgi:bifunctional DNase/RNase
MEKIRLEFSSLSQSQYQHGAYTLELIEADGRRMLKIAIGMFEAQSIAIELEHLTPTRPLTHDLFKSLSLAFNIELLEVVIYKLKEGVFYSRLVLTDGKNTHELDSRTSDAIALAVRFNCPIYTYDTILDQAGIVKDPKDDSESRSLPEAAHDQEPIKKPKSVKRSSTGSKGTEFSSMSEEQLNDTLSRALEDEEYELASKIRDEINKRKSTNIKGSKPQ